MTYVGDVHYPEHIVALPPQGLLQHVLHDVAAQVADMGKVIDRGTAGVEGDLARLVGLKRLLLVGHGVVKLHGIHMTVSFSVKICCVRPPRKKTKAPHALGMRGVFTRFHSRFSSKAGNGAEPWGIAPSAPGRTLLSGFP